MNPLATVPSLAVIEDATSAPARHAAARPAYWLTAVVSLASAGTLAGYQVISFLPEYLNLEARAVTVPFRAGMASLYLLLLVFGLCARHRLPLSKPTLALGVFWFLYLFRLLLDTTISEVPLHLPRDEFFACVLGMSLLPLLAFLMAPGGGHYRWAFGLVLTLHAATCALSLLRNLNDASGTWTRMAGNECLNPITLGHTGVSLVIMVLLLWLHRRGQRTTRFLAAAYAALALLGLYIVVAAASRGSITSLAVLLPLLLWLGWSKGARLWVGVTLAGIVCALPFVVKHVLNAGTDLSLYVGSREAILESESVLSRYTVIADAWQQFLQNPVWGSSLIERNSMLYPHNFIVESFMATGMVGGLAFCALVVLSIKKSIRLLRHHPTMAWAGALYLQALIGAMFSGGLYFAPVFWGLQGLVLAVAIPEVTPHALVAGKEKRPNNIIPLEPVR